MSQSSENNSSYLFTSVSNKSIKKRSKKQFSKQRTHKILCQTIPIWKNLSTVGNIIYFGGYLIDLDYLKDDSLFTLTERARAIKDRDGIQQIVVHKQNRTLQIYSRSDINQLDDFKQKKDTQNVQYVVDLLKSKNDQNLYQLSQLILLFHNKLKEHYNHEVFNYEVNKKMIDPETNYRSYQQKRQEFIDFINEKLCQEKESFYSYSVLGKNPESFEYQGAFFGISEGLLALLGTSLESAPQIYLRLGIVDFMNRKSRFDSLLASMKTFIERKVQNSFQINIQTYDFISIPATKITTRICQDENCPYEFQAFIQTYEIESSHLLRVIEERKEILHNPLANINNLDDYDFIYELQKEIFLEKFYKNQKQIEVSDYR
ncbi:hypothetical protein TTHERM_00219310 (macronuclear) [Tetrahymena thermophila SB210]|uniref:Uncharacterized protein n=1 Tax=Tetrahymena thermophila (strain SB210) TaxID=312017 RepID=I7MFM7_TETTS|nr:hypothetical protein TTHERM_00219310 [Tetrahymena thermophila SB210]EAS00358.1 hypothetical protein TTHERM_00219310 [Tetrahymena thermophila SB210]|eukprot:XP_001020603.1 hypothetical protein TTHERM_00219310 [Tetrahymena thermophila SB210]